MKVKSDFITNSSTCNYILFGFRLKESDDIFQDLIKRVAKQLEEENPDKKFDLSNQNDLWKIIDTIRYMHTFEDEEDYFIGSIIGRSDSDDMTFDESLSNPGADVKNLMISLEMIKEELGIPEASGLKPKIFCITDMC